ncbi:succinate-semialdehyde dehydrogenase / glutarate-semialdehyde dehydrogenase [Salinimicrobium catena]|uniref:Succinate-semialdehyde dehydrogenase / glutarate-semialdehyde dehydrogenase n=1 Tax=Salinimicrobium catena TaxID=390640 RepID=A0A1H5M764_9FLAO|nr:NAD-dependent succinate-semialdehyde dehydrogenase [Salinimicrobium catena]SDL18822.1 succinate-semialdehyde dehydrogenase / glutarate-semialdehyde dehydrogenase [Salinimicrobium catena]SEE84561.1 succinate-semialdehyde dehydrogenase / glutarate-semialdehyde dehydrogenase [Salinimicrobium catena]
MIVSKNPYNGKVLAEHKEFSSEDIIKALSKADTAFKDWRKTSFEERSRLLLKVAKVLKENKQEYAETMTKEMGKPISQSLAEVEKCAWVCEYYAENAEKQLSEEQITTDAKESFIRYDPLGVILAVMPWNYPFWQVFRFAAPALMAGNVCVLKHASNVMMCAANLEEIFKKAGFPEGCFKNLVIGSDKVEEVIKDARVKAVTLTGSGPAGSAVAATAGKEIKKTVLELGGSNALVVFKDANLEKTVKVCVQARFQNTGQSCIAGKRLLLQESVADEFLKLFKNEVENLKSGDPMDEDTYVGVQAREDLAKDLDKQVQESVKMGAEILMGGKRKDAYYEPTILTGVTPEMPVFKEETFGPAIGVTTFKDENEAIDLVNASQYGLGVSLFTKDLAKAKELAGQIEDGAVFVNELVKSDPRLPFGGTKNSGYGRELSFVGIKEFVNIKTVYINQF